MAEGSGVRRQPGQGMEGLHQCVFSRPKGVALLQAAVSALGVVPGAGSSSRCAFEVGLEPVALPHRSQEV